MPGTPDHSTRAIAIGAIRKVISVMVRNRSGRNLGKDLRAAVNVFFAYIAIHIFHYWLVPGIDVCSGGHASNFLDPQRTKISVTCGAAIQLLDAVESIVCISVCGIGGHIAGAS